MQHKTSIGCCFLFVLSSLGCGADSDAVGGREQPTTAGTFGNATPPAAGQAVGFGNPSAGVGGAAGQPVAGATTAGLAGACARVDTTVQRRIPRVTLVVDGSGSMDEAFGGASRWEALRSALVDPQQGLVSQLESTVEFGLAIYARSDAAACPTLQQVPTALDNFQALSSQYPARQLGGGTPTGEALSAVIQMLPDASATLDADPQPEIVILATDGMPNGCGEPPDSSICPDVPPLIPGFPAGPDPFCVLEYFANLPPDYQGTVDAAYAAQAKGIDLYVISLAPGQQELGELQRVANVGLGLDEGASPGAPIFEPSDPASLRDTLLSIIGGAVGCELDLEGRLDVARACEGTVRLNGNPLECGAEDGWRALDQGRIELTGQACRDFQGDPAVMVSASWPCGVVVD